MTMRVIPTTWVLLLVAGLAPAPGDAQEEAPDLPPEEAPVVSEDRLIAGAVLALPENLREGAEVRLPTDDGLRTLREGTNDMICLADRPGDEGFHVACYHASLDPFMEAGRRLRAEGVTGMQRQEARWELVETGEISVPDHPAMVYNLTVRDADATTLDPATVNPEANARLHAIYVPYATTESTGLPTRAGPGEPWLMWPGMPSAHIMVVIPPRSSEEEEGG